MEIKVLQGILLPFLGTSLGAGCVFFLRGEINRNLKRGMTGFAAGVMVSASVWSLLIPSMNHAEGMGKLAFFPAVVGFLLGMGFLLLLDTVTPHIHINQNTAEGPASSLPRTAMLLFAVTLHNIPEGMAVGVVYAGWITGEVEITALAALALALGIALQNFPEGAAVSVPLRREGWSRGKSFLVGQASALVEPVAGVIGAWLVLYVESMLPYALSFAAGAMILVAVHELIPECQKNQQEQPYFATMGIVLGFAAMMLLDVMLG